MVNTLSEYLNLSWLLRAILSLLVLSLELGGGNADDTRLIPEGLHRLVAQQPFCTVTFALRQRSSPDDKPPAPEIYCLDLDHIKSIPILDTKGDPSQLDDLRQISTFLIYTLTTTADL